ncbi:MAG: AhpC/TSA family protein [Prevotellaceae bacterium]|jgi:peroxiredoxin|nr:AhpC/TSA family protein [Prevotellaceae bacterium]
MRQRISFKGLLFTAALFAVYSCGNLHLDGTVEGVSSGKIYLTKFTNKMFKLIDSVDIKDGKFKFSASVELPEIYGLTLDNTGKNGFMIFLDKNPATVRLNSDNYRMSNITGSKLHDQYAEYLSKEKNGEIKIDEYVKENSSSLVALYVLYRNYSYRLTADEIRANLQQFDPKFQNTQYVKVLNELIATLEKVAIGKSAPDFTANDPQGNPVALSSHLKKGYLLLDFWASWCGPCRAENPNVVNAYKKYKDKGFDIFAVSLDAEKDKWIEAISKDSLTWTHVSDLLYWNSEPAKLYGVRAIPSNLLIDRDGIIIAKNLHGKELEDELEKIFKE